MKKEIILSLLKKMQKLHINVDDVEILLTKEELLLRELNNMEESLIEDSVKIILAPYDNINTILEALRILKQSTTNRCYIRCVLQDENIIKMGLALEGAYLIRSSKQTFNARFVTEALQNKSFLQAGIALKYAKLINETINISNAYYLLKYLLFKEVNTINMEGVKILSQASEEFQAKYIYYFLIDEKMNKAALAISGAKIISRSQNEFNAFFIKNILNNENLIKAGIALDAAQIIAKSLNPYNAECGYDILRNNMAITSGIALEGVKIVNNCLNPNAARCVVKLFKMLSIINPMEVLKTARMFEFHQVNYNYVYLLSQESLLSFNMIKILMGSKKDLDNLKSELNSSEKRTEIYLYLRNLVLENPHFILTANILAKSLLNEEIRLDQESKASRKTNSDAISDIIKVVENMPDQNISSCDIALKLIRENRKSDNTEK